VTAVFLAVTFTQVALVAHDLAHGQVFRTRRPGEVAGRIAGNLGIGMSYGWWIDKHTRHHNNPNHDDLDPDVAPEVLIWATQSALGRRGLKGFITRHQAALFFPLLTLLAADLKVSSIEALRSGTVKRRRLESTLLVLHAVGYLSALLIVLSPLQAIAFLLVHQALFGVYLGMTFAPNHKGMP
jgi:fatty acid desaturase